MVKASGILLLSGIIGFCVVININHVLAFGPVFVAMVKAIFSI